MWLNWFLSQKDDFCQSDFPKVYSGFVDYFIDSLHARGPAAPQIHQRVAELPLRLPAVERLVAIGDLHGDFGKTRRAFRAAGLIDKQDRWAGGTTTAVQVGDQLDRGDNEIRILYFLERLQKEASQQGGALHILNGNHETMNVAGRFRYTTPQGMEDFASWGFLQGVAHAMKASCACQFDPGPGTPVTDGLPALQSRIAALSPGGPLARRFLAPHPVILQVGSTVFVHGGILPQHARYGLERINAETKAWMSGQSRPEMPSFLAGRDAVVWSRDYSTEDMGRCNCSALEEVLSMMPGAKRMVVGHTIQEAGINSACQDKVYRIDVGLSHGCGDGEPEVLEILGDAEVRSLRESKAPKQFSGTYGSAEGLKSRAWTWWQQERRKVSELMS